MTRTRRAFLATLGVAAGGTLAGCGAGGRGDGTDTTADTQASGATPPATTTTHPSATTTGATTGTTERGPETPTLPGLQDPSAPFLDWEFDTGQDIAAAPGAHDDFLFVGTAGATARTPGGSDVNRLLLALDAAEGTERWRYPAAQNVTARPEVVGDTLLYTTGATGIAVTDDTGLTALGLDGSRRWRLETPPARILETTDSTVFLGVHEGQFGTDAYPETAVSAVDVGTGRERWRTLFGKFGVVTERDGTLFVGTNSEGRSEPAVTAVDARTGDRKWHRADLLVRAVTDAGLVGFRTGSESELVCLDHDGSERWGRAAGVSAVFATGDGQVYVAGNGQLRAHDLSDGSVRWRRNATFEWDSRAFAAGDAVYLTGGETVVAFAADGTRRWKRAVGGVRAEGLTTADRTVYVRTRRSGLVALDPASGEKRWRLGEGQGVYGPTVADGRLFATAASGLVYGLGTE